MAIIQISKIQQRSGNLVDLPQLDQGEFGWAGDVGKLYIGRTEQGGNIENVEVLTSYSNISFSQIDGSEGNLDISNALTGQILTYVSSSDIWVNAGGNALDPDNSAYYSNALIHLGDVSTLKLGGGGIGYILETDGAGNLSWTPKGTLYTRIENLTNDVGNGNIITMTVDHETPYINGQLVTITGANISNSTANSYINGNSFYVQLDGNFAANSGTGSGNVILYTDSALTTTANGAGLLTYVANSGVATAVLTGGGGGGNAGGANTSIQFNNTNLLDGSANFTFDFANNILTLNGNANVGNLNATSLVRASTLTSVVATGTAPLTVTSTTRVANLNVSHSNVSDHGAVTTQTTGTFYPVFANGNTTANYALGSNANIAFNAATGNLSATILNANGNLNGGNLVTAGGLYANGSFGSAGQVLTASNSNTAYWATTFYQGATPPAFSALNYGDIFFYDDGNGFQRMYMWVYDASGDYFYDFLPPNF